MFKFASGFTKRSACVTVTQGLVDILNEKELKAVLAHEVGHIVNGKIMHSSVDRVRFSYLRGHAPEFRARLYYIFILRCVSILVKDVRSPK